jgi:hypothetical protein
LTAPAHSHGDEPDLEQALSMLKNLDAEIETAITIFPSENSDMDDEHDGSTFAAACRKADAKARARPVPAEIRRARRLLDDSVSLERAHTEIVAHHFKGRAADSTLEALAFQLRAGVGVLKERDVRRRLSELSDKQLLEIVARVRRHKPEIAPIWSDDDVSTLMQLRETLR